MNARELNIDAAQRELDRRDAEGEDVSHLRVDSNGRIVDDNPYDNLADAPGYQDFAPQYR